MMRVELFGIRVSFDFVSALRRRRSLPVHAVRPEATEEASSAFWDAFQSGGTLVSTCRCGRTHFCSNTTLDYDEGELEGLLANAAVDPDKYIEDGLDDSLAVIDGPAGILVWGCPCHGAKAIEAFLGDFRSPILGYFTSRQRSAEIAAKGESLELLRAMGSAS